MAFYKLKAIAFFLYTDSLKFNLITHQLKVYTEDGKA